MKKRYNFVEKITYSFIYENITNKDALAQDLSAAHIHPDTKKIQSVSIHNLGAAFWGSRKCMIEELYHIVLLAGIFHDIGKYSPEFQTYIHKAVEDKELVRRGEVNHSTGGGLLVEKSIPNSPLSEMLQIAIYSHHGLCDCIDFNTGQYLVDKRNSRDYQEEYHIDLDKLESMFYTYINRQGIDELFSRAKEDFEAIKKKIATFIRDNNSKNMYGSAYFYMSMYERLLLSYLIDGDRLDTAFFISGQGDVSVSIAQKRNFNWNDCIQNYDNYMNAQREKHTKSETSINKCRQEISEQCKRVAMKNNRLYRLTVPTGSGKTLSSLRYALYHALKFDKQRIIYVAPYLSILDQNAEEIRKAIGDVEAVLEHHSNVLHESEEERRRYEQLIENWDSPIVVTTAVQLLETLFSAKTGSIRRMNSLVNSIIIWDEIQSLPPRVTGLFNLAINFLTEFCNTTVILCSATQPVLDELPKNRMLKPINMIEEIEYYDKAFRRTNLIDKTKLKAGGLSIEELGQFVLECFEKEEQVLVIVNTKACARQLYDYLYTYKEKISRLYHLSTNMCVLNRREKLAEMSDLMKKGVPMICISTQLIEAGVDISCKCVIRSLAGLDNIIQAAGRCNRHGEKKGGLGNVYIIKMSQEIENIGSMQEVKIAQEAMKDLLHIKSKEIDEDCNYLFSEEAKQIYYRLYYQKLIPVMDYTFKTSMGIQSTLVELLSGNQRGREQNKEQSHHFFHQAFRTTGELFEVIPEDGKIDVVVEYNEEIKEKIMQLQTLQYDFNMQKKIIKELQLATVGISEELRRNLGRAIYPICNGLIYVLNGAYYSKETGVSEKPLQKELIF